MSGWNLSILMTNILSDFCKIEKSRNIMYLRSYTSVIYARYKKKIMIWNSTNLKQYL